MIPIGPVNALYPMPTTLVGTTVNRKPNFLAIAHVLIAEELYDKKALLIMSTKELIEDPSLNERGMVVEVPHPQRGSFKTVGCPMDLSDSPVEVQCSPGLGEHTQQKRFHPFYFSHFKVRNAIK